MNNQYPWDENLEPVSDLSPQQTSNTQLGRTRQSAFSKQQTSDPAATTHVDRSRPVATTPLTQRRPVASGQEPSSDHFKIPIKINSDQQRPVATTSNQTSEPVASGRDHPLDPAATNSDQQRPTIPDGEETLTILQATEYLRDRGFDDIRTRSVQRYCTGQRRPGQLVCYWHDQSQQHLVSLSSLEQFAERLANELPTGTMEEPVETVPEPDATTENDSPDPVASGRDQDIDPSPPEAEIPTTTNFELLFEHPYVKRLERQVEHYQDKWEEQVKTTEEIQRQHSKDLESMHQQLMVATSKQYAEAYLELTGGIKAGPPNEPDYQVSDQEDPASMT